MSQVIDRGQVIHPSLVLNKFTLTIQNITLVVFGDLSFEFKK